jgi:hypothetical protein
LTEVENVLSADAFLKYMIRQLEAIKFAYDWRFRSSRPGIKKFKSDFVLKSFQNFFVQQNLRQYSGSDEEGSAYQNSFNAFKIRHGKTITARNLLLQLYEQVISPFLFIYDNIC